MWNKPQLMTAVADLLYVAAAAALLVAAVLWSARLPLFPLREVVFANELREVRQSDIERSLAGQLRGNFFSIKLDALRESLEQLPWVRRVEVRRQWPSRIEVSIEEHAAVAFWGRATGQLVNSYGEVFAAAMSRPPNSPMPVLQGPNGMAPEMLGHYQQAEEILKPLGRLPRAINVSPRLAVQLRLDDGMIIELGRQQAKAPVRERLERFVEFYPSVLSAAKQRSADSTLPVVVVDMRYPNGFALRVSASGAAPASDSKGTP
jgi:cell division protein FtsQ